jgi:hypothetical protein
MTWRRSQLGPRIVGVCFPPMGVSVPPLENLDRILIGLALLEVTKNKSGQNVLAD